MKATSHLTSLYPRGIPKKFELRSAYKPMEHEAFSGVVEVRWPQGPGVCMVKFNPQMPTWIGKKMPLGISAVYPARLRVWWMDDIATVWCSYVDESSARILWSGEAFPEWIKRVNPIMGVDVERVLQRG